MKPKKQTIVFILMSAVFIWALYQLKQIFEHISMEQVLSSFQQIPTQSVLEALFWVILNQVFMILYDWNALHYIQKPLSIKKIALTSLIGSSFSNNLGVFAGGSLRYRFYSLFSITAKQVTLHVSYMLFTFWFGLSLWGSVLFLLQPLKSKSLIIPSGIGALFIIFLAIYLTLVFLIKKDFKYKKIKIRIPTPSTALWQILTTAGDWFTVSMVLYSLLKPFVPISFIEFFTVFCIAQALGYLSQVPGGLGVIEALVLQMLKIGSSPQVISVLFCYRFLYYLMPFSILTLIYFLIEIPNLKSKT